jgi:hypothetical protein
MRTRTSRVAATVALLVAVPFLLTSCQRGQTVQPNEAKKDVVDVVDRTTEALGGKWTVRRGPALGKCPATAETDGVTWTYILDRGEVGDQTADRATVKDLWDSSGITTSDYESGGADPLRSVVGRGGPTGSIELLTRSDGYTVHGVSQCADGDYKEMLRRGED